MALLDFITDFVKQMNETKSPQEKGDFRHWKSPKGNDFIKKGGNGRKGETWFFKGKKSDNSWWR